MQSLFDQDKINEKDFSLLIDAFKQIRCFDAVQLLKGFFSFFLNSILFYFIDLEHQRRMMLSGLSQSTQSLASMMSSFTEEFIDDYEDDKICTESCE
jgi:DNA-binding MltR family transcriptional regulator